MEVSELSEGCTDVVAKEGFPCEGKIVNSDNTLTLSGKKDENGASENQPRVTYTKEDLLNLRESPASKLWPSILSDEYVRNGIWDPEAWHQSYSSEKRCASPGEELKKHLLVVEDGIVLSPQRQSFVQGCHIPQSAPEKHLLQERGKISRTTDRENDGRSRLTGRVGRGRTLDYKERTPLKEKDKDSDDPLGKYFGTRERAERIDTIRGSGKDKEKGIKGREKERRRSREEQARGKNTQVVKKKQGKDERKDEPEWFTFGPSSQFETMELKGFDDSQDFKKDQERRKSVSDEIKAILSVGKKGLLNGEVNTSSPETSRSASQNSDSEKKIPDAEGTAPDHNNLKAKPFDINDFFLSDTLLPLTGGVDQTSSRFCQFFGQPGSNYSSSRSGSAGFSSGGADTPGTPSPGPNYFFTPITPPMDDGTESESLSNMLQKTQVSVQPLLDEVMSSGKEKGKVMGSVRLEDIEADVKTDSKVPTKKELIDQEEENKEDIGNGVEITDTPEQMDAFNKLVQKMKSSGTLPEKPQPAISGLPTHLLPRPPSPKRKTPRNSPSPVLDLRRSPSPTDLLKLMTMQAPFSDHRPPSPAQVVPQMNRASSPLEMFQKFNSIVTSPQDFFASPLLGRSSSLHAARAQHRGSPPLGFRGGNLQLVPHQGTPSFKTRPLPDGVPHRAVQQSTRNPLERQASERNTSEKRSSVPVYSKSASSQSSSPYIPDRSFMPTSVMRKIQQDRMDQKPHKTEEKTQALDSSKEISVVDKTDSPSSGTVPQRLFTEQESSELRAQSQSEGDLIRGALFAQYTMTDEKLTPSQMSDLKQGILLSSTSAPGSPPLQKPTAFKPLPGSPQVPFSSLNIGIHSEPASPMRAFTQRASSTLPNSAPCTPQRHPLVDKAALLSPHQLFARKDCNKPSVGLFGPSISLESHVKNVRGGITKVVAANEGRPLTHSYEQQAQVPPDKMPSYEDAFPGKRSEILLGNHSVFKGGSTTTGEQKKAGSNEVTAQHEGLAPNHPRKRILGDARPTPVHHVPRPSHGPHGMWSGSHLPNGQLFSPSIISTMQGHPGRTPFNSPMQNMGMSPRPGLHPGMMPPRVHPGYLRMMSSASTPMGIPSPGMAPASSRMQMLHSTGRIPAVPGHYPAMMFSGRPIPGYPPGNPAAAVVAASMTGTRSPHIPLHSGGQQIHGRRAASPAVNHPPQSRSPVGGGNILSKWFSDDILQQANPGQRSTTPDFAKKVVSVEELERLQAAAIN